MPYLVVFVGGGLGVALRHGVNRAALAMLGPGFPFGTLIVNVAGGVTMGVLAGLFLVKGIGDQNLRLFLTTGLLGGFTTFSAFSLDAALLWQRGAWGAFGAYVAGSVALSILGLFLGLAAVRLAVRGWGRPRYYRPRLASRGEECEPRRRARHTGAAKGEAGMASSARTPMHLWIVAALATLWNAFGAFDYLMTQTRNEAYLANFTDPQRIYFDSFPIWMEATWAFGVWGGLAGALLLLARSRYAATAFAVSLAGLAASTVYQYVLSTPPADMMSGAMMAMNLAIWAIAIGLLWYALRMRRAGVLR